MFSRRTSGRTECEKLSYRNRDRATPLAALSFSSLLTVVRLWLLDWRLELACTASFIAFALLQCCQIHISKCINMSNRSLLYNIDANRDYFLYAAKKKHQIIKHLLCLCLLHPIGRGIIVYFIVRNTYINLCLLINTYCLTHEKCFI